MGWVSFALGPKLAARPWPRRGSGMSSLLRVQLDDELLLHRHRNLGAVGMSQHLRREAVVVGLEPGGDRGHEVGRLPDRVGGPRARTHGDHVVGAHLVGRDVDPAPVDRPVAVQDELTRLAPRAGEAEPHEHVVEPALEHAQQVLAGDAGLAARAVVVVAELLLEHAVVAPRLLLLAQLEAILRLLLASAPVLPGRIGAALDAALLGQAALALEEELLALSPALLALGPAIAC